MKEIDARGLSCPAPVLLLKTAIEQEGAAQVRIIVDNRAAKENIALFLESKQFAFAAEEREGNFFITGSGDPAGASLPAAPLNTESEKILVLAATDRIGHGDDDLGRKLMANFIRTLKEMGPSLWRLIFVNNGVKLAVRSSEVLPDLTGLADSGVKILVCGTCLAHFNLLDEKGVGETTNMLDIVTALQVADKVINL